MSDPQGWWAKNHVRDERHVTAEWLEWAAFKTGRTITIGKTRAQMQVGSVLYVAPLPLPATEVAS